MVHRRLIPSLPLSRECSGNDLDGCEDRDEPCLVDAARTAGAEAEAAAAAHEAQRGGSLLALLCIPARYVPTDVIALLAPYSPKVTGG